MCAWEFFLPFCFSTNKHNYARYSSWYVHQMRNRDSLHSGNEIIFSVHSQARYNLRTAVDQREEQSLNKDRKTVDGVRRFSADNDAVTKWTMGRDDKTWKLNFLLQMCNIRQQCHEYKYIAFTDPAVRIMHVKCCCSFGEWPCQPVWYCARQDHVDKP